MLNRRNLGLGAAALAITACAKTSSAQDTKMESKMSNAAGQTEWSNLTEAEWKERLTDQEFYVLRQEGTERAGTSPLNNEKREGTFVCAGCALPLFKSETKYESGTGWPSFFDVIKENIGTKADNKLFMKRTEYHCARCGGHQGHVFTDGPRPTGLRYCNNGIALDFVAA